MGGGEGRSQIVSLRVNTPGTRWRICSAVAQLPRPSASGPVAQRFLLLLSLALLLFGDCGELTPLETDLPPPGGGRNGAELGFRVAYDLPGFPCQPDCRCCSCFCCSCRWCWVPVAVAIASAVAVGLPCRLHQSGKCAHLQCRASLGMRKMAFDQKRGLHWRWLSWAHGDSGRDWDRGSNTNVEHCHCKAHHPTVTADFHCVQTAAMERTVLIEGGSTSYSILLQRSHSS